MHWTKTRNEMKMMKLVCDKSVYSTELIDKFVKEAMDKKPDSIEIVIRGTNRDEEHAQRKYIKIKSCDTYAVYSLWGPPIPLIVDYCRNRMEDGDVLIVRGFGKDQNMALSLHKGPETDGDLMDYMDSFNTVNIYGDWEEQEACCVERVSVLDDSLLEELKCISETGNPLYNEGED